MTELICECGKAVNFNLNGICHSVISICKKCKKMNEFTSTNPCKLEKIQMRCDCGNCTDGRCNICEQYMCQV